jgi:uncharacterized membrane protein
MRHRRDSGRNGSLVQEAGTQGGFPLGVGILFGIGFGGFFDGIVFHQLLQWHHMVSGWYPPDNLPNLRLNTLWDGIFHSLTWSVLVLAVYGFVRAARRGRPVKSLRRLAASALMGWGLFNLVEGVADHVVLGVHRVNELVAIDQRWLWDAGFLLWGALMLGLGWAWFRSPARRP